MRAWPAYRGDVRGWVGGLDLGKPRKQVIRPFGWEREGKGQEIGSGIFVEL